MLVCTLPKAQPSHKKHSPYIGKVNGVWEFCSNFNEIESYSHFRSLSYDGIIISASISITLSYLHALVFKEIFWKKNEVDFSCNWQWGYSHSRV